MNPSQENQVSPGQPIARTELTPQQTSIIKILSIIAAALWIIALPLTAYVSPDDGGNVLGLTCFIYGWEALLITNVFVFAGWISNFLAYSVIRMAGANQPSANKLLIYSVLAFILSFGAFGLTSYPRDEGSSVYFTVKPGIGLYLWLLAITCTAAMGLYRYLLLLISDNK